MAMHNTWQEIMADSARDDIRRLQKELDKLEKEYARLAEKYQGRGIDLNLQGLKLALWREYALEYKKRIGHLPELQELESQLEDIGEGDHLIDFSDIPELTEEFFENARRGAPRRLFFENAVLQTTGEKDDN